MSETQISEAFKNAEPVKLSLRERVEELAAMAPADYLEISKAVATEYEISPGELNGLVKKERSKRGGNSGQGEAFTIDPPEPWPHPVDGDRVADELRDQISRYVWLPDGASEVVTLWILHTHIFDAWRVSPRLFITSPEKGCGKSTLLNGILGRATCKPLMAANVAPAVLFRVIALHRPCLLIDEVDAFMKRDEELRSIVNSSHTSDGAVLRCVGDDHEPRKFSTWAPMALAGIGNMPDTIEDRSILVRMQRRSDSEPTEDIDSAALATFETFARKATRWADGMGSTLADYRPAIPAGMANRIADNWRPLLAVADAIGGHWPRTIREVAQSYAVRREENSARVQALEDIVALFEERRADRLASTYIAEQLAEMDDRPWPEWKNGKPMTTAALARLLKPLGIKANHNRHSTGQYRGYDSADFEDPYRRYVSQSQGTPLTQSVTVSQSTENNGLCDFQSVTAKNRVTLSNSDKPLKNNESDTVTLWKGEGKAVAGGYGGTI